MPGRMLCPPAGFPVQIRNPQKPTICNPLAIARRLRHFAGVRGSPLLRSIFILLALAMSGLALVKLTATQQPPPVAAERAAAAPTTALVIPYQLMLSAQASSIEIAGNDRPPLDQPSGTLSFDPKNPFLTVFIRWKTPPAPGERRFAKLTLDPPGKPTLTHVFDSAGDIDDLFELPR